MRRDGIDFQVFPAHQEVIHGRLQNWARWCFDRSGASVSPMFRGYRSTDVWAAPTVSEPVDTIDAARVAKAVIALPEWHRHSVNWYYIKPVHPKRAAQALAVTVADLAQTVIDARQMLINRGA